MMPDRRERAKELKREYFPELVDRCGKLVEREADLSKDERDSLVDACIIDGIKDYETIEEACYLETAPKRLLKTRRFTRCMTRNTPSEAQLERFVEQEAAKIRQQRQDAKDQSLEVTELDASLQEFMAKLSHGRFPLPKPKSEQLAPPSPPSASNLPGPHHQGSIPVIQSGATVLPQFSLEEDLGPPRSAAAAAGKLREAISDAGSSQWAQSRVITRSFGLSPLEARTIPPRIFTRFQVCVNRMVKAGRSLPDTLFQKEGLNAVMRFYHAVMRTPSLKAFVQRRHGNNAPLLERARRCAAQFAYFILREFKLRLQLLPVLTASVERQNPLSVFQETFPDSSTLQHVRKTLDASGLSLTPGQRSTIFLENNLRQVRNLVRQHFTTHRNHLGAWLKKYSVPSDFALTLRQWLLGRLEGELVAFLRILSLRLTRRIKGLLKTKTPQKAFGDAAVDALLQRLLTRGHVTLKTLDLVKWQRLRKQWREAALHFLQGQLRPLRTAVDRLVARAVHEAQTGLTVERLLNLLFRPRPPYISMKEADLGSFQQFLKAQVMYEAQRRISETFRSQLVPDVVAFFQQLRTTPWKWCQRPIFRQETIPLGVDDGQIYQYQANNLLPQGQVRLNLEKGVPPIHFALQSPARCMALLRAGYLPGRGTLSKRPQGGLILAIPFQKALSKAQSQPPAIPQAKPVRVAGLDLGLKTFGVLSIREVRQTAQGLVFDRSAPEIARYFVDQRQLAGKRDGWFHGMGASPVNWKRRLTALQGEARRWQQRMANAKQHALDHGIRQYRHTQKYSKCRRAWKQVWRRLKHLHEEIARQLATRYAAVLQAEGVVLLRMEDLSWARHAARNQTGYFLSTWQTHWFFSQVQQRVAELAERAGIAVEWVNARGTSQQCSRCGKPGRRDGKIFKCLDPRCGVQLDADLNAARNIVVAAHSPTARGGGGGYPFRPPLS